MISPRISRLLLESARILWAATLVTIPVTSFRYFPAGEGTFIRPLAALPLALLLIVMGIRTLRREAKPPRVASFTPLMALLLVAAFTSVVGILLDPIPLRGQDATGRVLRAWITVLIGVSCFVGAAWMNRDEQDVRFSVRWLLIGFAADVLWSGVQAATFYLDLLPKPLVTQWQRLFSLRELIRTNRISGMAYEPSWLAGQIATVYLPWLLAAGLTRVRVFRVRWLESLLLLVAPLVVLATYSRGGLLTMGLSAVLAVAYAGQPELRSAWNWFASARRNFASVSIRAGLVAMFLLALVAAGLWLGQKGYISRLWESSVEDLPSFLVQNSAGARGAYLVSAMQTYQDYPWTGVGLGASGLYMYSRMPDWSMTSVPEIARQFSPESSLYPNPKNLYVRLLAETGLPGLLVFATLMFAFLAAALQALQRGTPFWRYVGIAGLCTWLAVMLFNMTQDSLATPNLWLNFGILAGFGAFGGDIGNELRRGAPRRRALERQLGRKGSTSA